MMRGREREREITGSVRLSREFNSIIWCGCSYSTQEIGKNMTQMNYKRMVCFCFFRRVCPVLTAQQKAGTEVQRYLTIPPPTIDPLPKKVNLFIDFINFASTSLFNSISPHPMLIKVHSLYMYIHVTVFQTIGRF